MNINNPLYRDQGIHVIATMFTVDKGEVKVLLIKRKLEPYKGYWILPGGAVYNNEDTDTAIKREIKEKTGFKDIYLKQFQSFSNPNRSPQMRMIAIGYLALIDSNRVELLKETEKTSDANWFALHEIPKLGYDHEIILQTGMESLRQLLMRSNIARTLLPNKFTLPNLQKTYEKILNRNFDRRNFRKKFLNLGLVEVTNEVELVKGHRPANYYKFKHSEYIELNIF